MLHISPLKNIIYSCYHRYSNTSFVSEICLQFTKTGHVVTTIMFAQIKEVRKGLKTQKLAAISAPINRTAKVMRVTSREADTFLFVTGFFLSIYLHMIMILNDDLLRILDRK